MIDRDSKEPGCVYLTLIGVLFVTLLVGGVMFMLVSAIEQGTARGADFPLPPEILLGRSHTPPPQESATLGVFGTYGTHYMRRRWARLCKGGGRYQAMAEAYERGLHNPCR